MEIEFLITTNENGAGQLESREYRRENLKNDAHKG